jgi:hypothetical protein
MLDVSVKAGANVVVAELPKDPVESALEVEFGKMNGGDMDTAVFELEVTLAEVIVTELSRAAADKAYCRTRRPSATVILGILGKNVMDRRD